MDGAIVSHWSKGAPHAPFVTVGISLICLFALLIYTGLSPMMQQAMIDVLGMNPSVIASLLEGPVGSWWNLSALSVLTALFVHASWLHLLGNLAYLWVFGMKVEQNRGALGLLLVFLAGGALANLIVALRLPSLDTPIIGASGGVSAVVGAYLGWFPRGVLLFPELEEVAFSLQPGQYSEVIETNAGYHIIYVIDKGTRQLSSEIRMLLEEEAVSAWLEEARGLAEIEVLVILLLYSSRSSSAMA